jgi:NADH-quinone oxidoreductase subunit N
MNTLIAIIGLGVLCLLFEILNLRKAIIPMTIIGLLYLDLISLNSIPCRLLQQYDYCQ